jgi:succinate-semialdehyde dehydrogenase/glutarate-semialdehyde dehydrogenase
MPFFSQNPATEVVSAQFPSLDRVALLATLAETHAAQQSWRHTTFAERAQALRRLGQGLLARRDEFARLITEEMGKVTREARAEVEKCATICDYYASEGESFLTPEPMTIPGARSYVAYAPIGVVLGVMPWNFPFWQVFRFAVPALMAGNGVVFKHAPNVPRCALAIASLLQDTGMPAHLMTSLFIEDALVAEAIGSPHVHAVTVTGSERAGRAVASIAGAHLKKCILELGGSDPFVVLADADLEWAARQGLSSRYMNCGQACIAAKRFILVPEIADAFLALFAERVATLKPGDPFDSSVTLGPMARRDLRDHLDLQVKAALSGGAEALLGAHPLPGPGWFYAPTILDRVTPQSPIWQQELFGPVALIVRARDEANALALANDTPYGLGSTVWSRDIQRAEQLAGQIDAGCTFINGLVKSDPRLPFGGTKNSGFGRELSSQGIREFTNLKTVWIKNPT